MLKNRKYYLLLQFFFIAIMVFLIAMGNRLLPVWLYLVYFVLFLLVLLSHISLGYGWVVPPRSQPDWMLVIISIFFLIFFIVTLFNPTNILINDFSLLCGVLFLLLKRNGTK